MLTNMKIYIPTLLIFFLLVDTSVSPPLPLTKFKPLAKDIYRKIRNDFLKRQVESIWRNLTNPNGHPSPSPPDTQVKQPVKIGGLHLVKEYLSRYGYIQYSDQFTDYLDDEMASAIKRYQEFFNLDGNGQLDNITLTRMDRPRCAVPDVNFTYDLITSNVSWPKGTGWFPDGTKELTYGFLPESQIPLNMTKVFKDSFNRWSQAIMVLNFSETTFDNASIKIGFYLFDNETMGEEVVGGTIIQLPNDSHIKIFGDMRLDGESYWVLPTDNITSWSWEDGLVDLETVVMHQIGHLLGLNHSPMEDAVMYPYILPSPDRKSQLSDDDKEQIQQVYYSGGGRPLTLGVSGSSLGHLTTLSLGLAAMLVFD